MGASKHMTRIYPFWKDLFLPKLALFFLGVPKNSFGSVDVTNKCNLRCKHCYFFADPQKREMEPDEIIAKISEMTGGKGKVWNCTWVGGEPLLRKEIVERLIPRFKYNKVVTNGTISLPDWRSGVTFYISVDGTEEIHDEIRGKGSYARLKKNVDDPANLGKHIRLACCLNQLNKNYIEAILEEWHSSPYVKEILFDFFTPVGGDSDDLWIPFDERDRIIDKIIDLKRNRYGRFIGAPETTYLLMKRDNRLKAVGKNCSFMQKGFAINAYGERKKKCMMGPGADCDRCGCIVPFYLKSLDRRYLLKELLKDVKGLFVRLDT